MRATLGLGTSAVVDVIDEDDMVTDSATRPPSQQSVKAYVDANTVAGTATAATTGGTTVDISTAIPAAVTEITVMFSGVSMSGTDLLLVQASTSSIFATSGYVSESGALSGAGQSIGTETSGFVVNIGAAASAVTGLMTMSRFGSTNEWVVSHSTRQATTQVAFGGGSVTLGGAIDGLRLKTSGLDTFDAGSVSIRWRV
jgi:hypothetical protein